METKGELLACPFCGNEPELHQGTRTVMPHVVCNRCETCGPTRYDWDEAIDAWNARALTASNPLEALSESDKDIALAQAVTFAEYVSEHAKGKMVDAAKHFLSLEYSEEIAARLNNPLEGLTDGEFVKMWEAMNSAALDFAIADSVSINWDKELANAARQWLRERGNG